MSTLLQIFIILHIVGFALVFGGAVGQFSDVKQAAARVTPAILWGALLLLVTGLAMVGLIYAVGGQPNNMKIGVKLVILLGLLGHVLAVRKKENLSMGALSGIAVLALANASIAVLWH